MRAKRSARTFRSVVAAATASVLLGGCWASVADWGDAANRSIGLAGDPGVEASVGDVVLLWQAVLATHGAWNPDGCSHLTGTFDAATKSATAWWQLAHYPAAGNNGLVNRGVGTLYTWHRLWTDNSIADWVPSNSSIIERRHIEPFPPSGALILQRNQYTWAWDGQMVALPGGGSPRFNEGNAESTSSTGTVNSLTGCF